MEGLAGVGVGGGGQGLGEIDLVEVGGAGVGVLAVEPPELAVGDDDPVGLALIKGGHHAGSRVLVGGVGVVQVGAVQPAVPGIDKGGRQDTTVGGLEFVVRLGLVGPARPVDAGPETQTLEQGLEELGADDVLVLALPAFLGIGEQVADKGETLGRVVPPGGVFTEAFAEEVVREQAAVLEELLAVTGSVEDAAEFVELVETVGPGPGEAAQGLEVEPGGSATGDADDLRDHLHTVSARGT
jgi:hypothetical protein